MLVAEKRHGATHAQENEQANRIDDSARSGTAPLPLSTAQEEQVADEPGSAARMDLWDCFEEIGFRAERSPMHASLAKLQSSLPGVHFTAHAWVYNPETPLAWEFFGGELPWVLVVPQGQTPPPAVPGQTHMVVLETDLRAVVEAHQAVPFSLEELAQAIRESASSAGRSAFGKLAHGSRSVAAVLCVVSHLLEYGALRQSLGETGVVEEGEFFWFLQGNADLRGTLTRPDVRGALDLLSSPAVGALKKEGAGYVQVMASRDVIRRLAGLGHRMP